MSLPANSRFFSRETGIDKVDIVKAALASAPIVAFAGDGRPDLAPALLVPPHLRFARGWLADALSVRGESFRPFERWSQIADVLLQLPSSTR
jgi:2-hydroxy-3-keto-5-methylthiopentenyl-1-phosphate phosphatase